LYKIIFYEDENGSSEVVSYIKELQKRSKKSKECRVLFNKIVAYLDMLEEQGTRIGEPFTKHLEEDLWELRPLKHRFLYAYYKENTFVILHHFMKKTQKTPKRELKNAKRKLMQFKEREMKNDNVENS
jgi:phage-related protein